MAENKPKKIPYKHRTVRIDDDGDLFDSVSVMTRRVLCPFCDRGCNAFCAAFRSVEGKDNVLCIAGPKGLILGKIGKKSEPDEDDEIESEDEEEDTDD